jgi:RNA polymerase sigma-70 factor (ECF subfamily)
MNDDACDRGLVRRAQAGDRGAFGVLVSKYRRRVMQLSLRYTRNHADAEDVVQETFMKAYGALYRFRGEAQFYSWIHRIAINSATNALALRRRRGDLFAAIAGNARDESNEASGGQADWDTPERLALTEELGVAVAAAIEALPTEQRTAIALLESEQFTYAQVAESMDCPIGTVKSRVFRARDAIGGCLRRSLGAVPARQGSGWGRGAELSDSPTRGRGPRGLKGIDSAAASTGTS